MNIKNCAYLQFLTLALAVISSGKIAANEKTVGPVVAPTHVVVSMSVSTSASASVPGSRFELMAMARPDAESARWNAIKDEAYAARSKFIAGLKQMELRVGDQLGELKVRRATLKGGANSPRSDLAIKELGYARSFMKYMGEELHKATPENWNQQKAKVGETWARTQEFYAMGKSALST